MAIYSIKVPCVPNEGGLVTMCTVLSGTIMTSLKNNSMLETIGAHCWCSIY